MAERSLGKYLLLLATHPDILQEFLNDPEALLEKSGLSTANKNIMTSNDLTRVLTQIQEEEGPEPGDVLLPQ